MRPPKTLALAAALLGAGTAAAAGGEIATSQTATPEHDVFPYPVHEQTLDNGLKVVVIPYPSPGVVAYFTVVRTGSRAGGGGRAQRLRPLLRAHDVPRHRALPRRRLQRRRQAHGSRLQRLHHRRLHLLLPGRSGGRAGDHDGHRVGPFQALEVRRGGLQDRGAGGARRVQQERVEPVSAAGGEAPRPRLQPPHLQAHHHRLSRRRPGDAGLLRLQSRLLRPLLPPRKRRAVGGGRRRARPSVRRGEEVLRRLAAGLPAGGHPGRAAADRRADGAPPVGQPHPALPDDRLPRPRLLGDLDRHRRPRPRRPAPHRRLGAALPPAGGGGAVGRPVRQPGRLPARPQPLRFLRPGEVGGAGREGPGGDRRGDRGAGGTARRRGAPVAHQVAPPLRLRPGPRQPGGGGFPGGQLHQPDRGRRRHQPALPASTRR